MEQQDEHSRHNTASCCALTYSPKKPCVNEPTGRVSVGKGEVAGADAKLSVAVAPASEAPTPSISPTGPMPPVGQPVFYDECKFRSYPVGNYTHKIVLKVVHCRGERGTLSPRNRGIQIIEGKVVGLLGIPSCLSPHSQFFYTGVRPEGKSVGVCGGLVRIVHCGMKVSVRGWWVVNGQGTARQNAERMLLNMSRRSYRDASLMSLAPAITALTDMDSTRAHPGVILGVPILALTVSRVLWSLWPS